MREGSIDATVVLRKIMGTIVDEGEAVLGARAEELRAAAVEVRDTVVADPARTRRLAERHGDTWDHGAVASCRFDAGPAVCHRLARQMGDADPEPGPLVFLCVGVGRTNAHYTTLPLPALQAGRAAAGRTAAASAGSPRTHPLACDLAELDAVIAEPEGSD